MLPLDPELLIFRCKVTFSQWWVDPCSTSAIKSERKTQEITQYFGFDEKVLMIGTASFAQWFIIPMVAFELAVPTGRNCTMVKSDHLPKDSGWNSKKSDKRKTLPSHTWSKLFIFNMIYPSCFPDCDSRRGSVAPGSRKYILKLTAKTPEKEATSERIIFPIPNVPILRSKVNHDFHRDILEGKKQFLKHTPIWLIS